MLCSGAEETEEGDLRKLRRKHLVINVNRRRPDVELQEYCGYARIYRAPCRFFLRVVSRLCFSRRIAIISQSNFHFFSALVFAFLAIFSLAIVFTISKSLFPSPRPPPPPLPQPLPIYSRRAPNSIAVHYPSFGKHAPPTPHPRVFSQRFINSRCLCFI